MKISNLTYLLCCLLLMQTSCTDLIDDITPTLAEPAPTSWQDQLPSLIFDSNIIVTPQGSIQEAIEAATPGDAILIEAGNYSQPLNIHKEGIKLVGIDGPEGEKVLVNARIEVSAPNVELLNIHHASPHSNTASMTSKRPHKTGRLLDISRRRLEGGITHYQFLVQLGPGQYDIINIHRVVREHGAYRPVKAQSAVFMIHGAAQDFDDIFLQAGNQDLPTASTSSPVFLAARGIDVWGIDLAWTRVPAETTDFAFMADWGMERDVKHTLKAMSIARLIRGMTGQGYGPINLLGFSYGVSVAYAAAGQETRFRKMRRSIKGLLAVDGFMKYAAEDEEFRLNACAGAEGLSALLNSGVYENNNLGGTVFGNLALSLPDEPSDFIPGLTNFQAALFIGAVSEPGPQAPFWHFLGSDLSEPFGVPSALLYTEPDRWFRLLTVLAPYQPVATLHDLVAGWCDEEDVFTDDYLSKISVPILYLGSGGGNGVQGLYTSSLTASSNVTQIVVSLEPEELRYKDFGHADLWLASEADQLVWRILHRWLVTHGSRHGS